MPTQSPIEKFRHQLSNLRLKGMSPQMSDIVDHALDAGLSFDESIREIFKLDPYSRGGENNNTGALECFVSELCSRGVSGSIVEYSDAFNVLTSSVVQAVSRENVLYISKNVEIINALGRLPHPSNFSVSSDVSSVSGRFYETIICSPALGYRSPVSGADGFGGEVVSSLAGCLSESGLLLWITTRGVIFTERGQRGLAALAAEGLSVLAIVELAPGALNGVSIGGVLIILGRGYIGRRMVASLRDPLMAQPLANAFLVTKKDGSCWSWVDADDMRTFGDIERAEHMQSINPGKNCKIQTVSSVLVDLSVQRADKKYTDDDGMKSYIFVPEYLSGKITNNERDQTVKLSHVYRLEVDAEKVNPNFIVELMNSVYGYRLREAVSTGSTIRRISHASLLSINIPVPSPLEQAKIASMAGDINLLLQELRSMKENISADWGSVGDFAEKVDAVKAALDIEHRIANWGREMPYPLASIHRRIEATLDPKEKFDILLHFFEMMAIYLATFGTSYVRALRADWSAKLSAWLHPKGHAGLSRPDFGFWNRLAEASLNELVAIVSEVGSQTGVSEVSISEITDMAAGLGGFEPLKAINILEYVRVCRNNWKGHSGHIKESDAVRLSAELMQKVRECYVILAPLLRSFQLVRPGKAMVLDEGYRYETERLIGSDPTFDKEIVDIDSRLTSGSLAFWVRGNRKMYSAIPFFRLGAPANHKDVSCYIFNRFESRGMRWISYQEAIDQEIYFDDEEIVRLINSKKKNS